MSELARKILTIWLKYSWDERLHKFIYWWESLQGNRGRWQTEKYRATSGSTEMKDIWKLQPFASIFPVYLQELGKITAPVPCKVQSLF